MAVKPKSAANEKAPAQAGAEKKFAIEKLQANCRELFGVSTSTFVGATYGMTGKYTVDEMRAHIEAWKKEGVK